MWLLGFKGPSGFSARSTAEEVTQGIDGSGLTAIVTGSFPLLGFFFFISCFFSFGFCFSQLFFVICIL